jgi:phenylalanine-4-hydroxylase
VARRLRERLDREADQAYRVRIAGRGFRPSEEAMFQEPTQESAYEKAGREGLDPRCVPIALDGPVPEGAAIPYPSYPDSDHGTWTLLYARQRALLEGKACREYLDGLTLMSFPERRIPSLAEASAVLERTTGWHVARVPGLLHERDFFGFLARRVFASTDYIRPPHEADYTPAPDMFHDVFGHMPMITNPAFADFYQRMGQAALSAEGPDRRCIERFYWFTVEFGLIATNEGIRIYGNGILSSYGEVRHSLTEAVKKLPFDAEAIVSQEYDVWHFQPLLFVIESFDQLAEGFDRWARKRGLLA